MMGYDKTQRTFVIGIVRESTDGSISLIDVPIVTPNCEIIVPRLTIRVSFVIFLNHKLSKKKKENYCTLLLL